MLFGFDLRGRTPNLTQGVWMSRVKHFPSASYPSILWGRHGHQRSGGGVVMLECYPRHRRGYRISHLRIYALFFAGLGGGPFSVSAKNITEKFCSDGNTLFRTFLNHFFWVYLPWLVLFEGCGYAAANSATRKEKPQDLFFDVLSTPGSTLDIHECISNPKKDFVNGRSWAKRKYTPKTSTRRRKAYLASTFTLLLDFCVFGWKLFVTFLWWPSNPFNG